jgi:hypothetical protein
MSGVYCTVSAAQRGHTVKRERVRTRPAQLDLDVIEPAREQQGVDGVVARERDVPWPAPSPFTTHDSRAETSGTTSDTARAKAARMLMNVG